MDEPPDEARGPDEDRRGQENDPVGMGPPDRRVAPPDEDDDGHRWLVGDRSPCRRTRDAGLTSRLSAPAGLVNAVI